MLGMLFTDVTDLALSDPQAAVAIATGDLVSVTKQDLIGYANATRARTLSTLEALSAEDLEREMTDIGGNTAKTGEYLGRVATDYHQHCGQICYLRGFITGFGWAF